MTELLLLLVLVVVSTGTGVMIYIASSNDSDGNNVPDQQDLRTIDDPTPVLDVAQHHEDRNNYRKAIEAWSHYQELEPEDPAGFLRRGINWQQLGEYEKALEDFKGVDDRLDELPTPVSYYRAKCYAALDREEQALDAYESYLRDKPEELSAWEPVAKWATRKGYYDRARTFWKHIHDRGDSVRSARATLQLTEVDLLDGHTENASGRLEGMDSDQLGEENGKYYDYLKGRLRETQGRESEALDYYRTLHDSDPDYRDVAERFGALKTGSDDGDPLERYRDLPPESFGEFCQDIVRDLGLKVTDVEIVKGEEVTVMGRESSGLIGEVDRYLFAFRRWENPAGQMTVKDFEMSLLEEGYDRGYFVNSGGYKRSAKRLAEGNPDLILKTPEEMLGNSKSEPEAVARTGAALG